MARNAMLCLLVLAVGRCAWAQDDFTEARVKDTIEKGVKYLYLQANRYGVWDTPPFPPATKGGKEAASINSLVGGKTSLVLTAIALAGHEKDPNFQKAMDWLKAQNVIGTYAVSARLQLIRSLSGTKDYSAIARRDAAYLQAAARQKRDTLMWSYLGPPVNPTHVKPLGDLSNVNYAVLGLWAACDLNLEIPQRVWLGLERTWCEGQMANGGWCYYPIRDTDANTNEAYRTPRGSMTAAGIASLYLVLDQCYAIPGELHAYRHAPAYKSIQAGLKWLGENYSASSNPGRPYFATYYFYNCERVGAAAGLKYFGGHDWFREMGRTLVGAQRPDGSIPMGLPESLGGPLVDTAYALMFLARGSSPVLMNKMQHKGDWENHPRDLAALANWYARVSEGAANWQVVDLNAPAEDLTDAPILFLSGTEPLTFTDEEKGKLKRFVELGGLLVFHPDTDATVAAAKEAATRPTSEPASAPAPRPLPLPPASPLPLPSAVPLPPPPSGGSSSDLPPLSAPPLPPGPSTSLPPLPPGPSTPPPLPPGPSLKPASRPTSMATSRPDGNAANFEKSVRKLLAELWPNYEMKSINVTDHPLGTYYHKLKEAQKVEQFASPTRVLAFVVHGAPSEAWEQRMYKTREGAFDLAADLYCYATDLQRGQPAPSKLNYFAEAFRRPIAPTERAVALARVKYGTAEHRWNPEPLAFDRFVRRLAADKKVNCQLKVVTPAELPASGCKFAHLTGIDEVSFTKDESNAIVTFLKAGGTLIIDQAGGPRKAGKQPFDESIRKYIDEWCGKDTLVPTDANHPLLGDIEGVTYRNVEQRRHRMPLALEHVVQNGRSVIYYSRYDLTCGLLGTPNPLTVGPDIDGCFDIMQRIVAAPEKPPEPPKPAEAPK